MGTLALMGAGPLSPVVSPSSLLTGLVAYYSLEEASSTTRVDATSRGNNLTDHSVAQVGGKVGNGAQFVAASSQYLNHADNADLRIGNNPATMCGWIYLDSKGANRTLCGKWVTGLDYLIDYEPGGDHFRFIVGDGAGGVAGSVSATTFGSPSTSTWYFLSGIYEPGVNIRLAVNAGTFDTSTPGTGGSSSDQFCLGALSTPTNFHDGRIDEFGKWSVVLTPTQVSNLYAAGSGTTFPFVGVP